MGWDLDFEAFEQLVLRAYFETKEPLTSAYLSYLTRTPARVTERFLARMVECGTLDVRAMPDGVVEYYVPGGKHRGDGVPAGFAARHAHARAPEGSPEAAASFAAATLPPPAPESASPLTAVCLSVLVPGAGHIYTGRPGVGVAWMASTLLGYACCFFPGIFLHGLCMLSAAHAGATTRNGSGA